MCIFILQHLRLWEKSHLKPINDSIISLTLSWALKLSSNQDIFFPASLRSEHPTWGRTAATKIARDIKTEESIQRFKGVPTKEKRGNAINCKATLDVKVNLTLIVFNMYTFIHSSVLPNDKNKKVSLSFMWQHHPCCYAL